MGFWRRLHRGEQGAALIIALLFLVVTQIFLLTMLHINSNELIISRVHQASVVALDHGQAGLQEAINRSQGGHPAVGSFSSSLDPWGGNGGTQVSMAVLSSGTGAGIRPMTYVATAQSQYRLAARRLSQVFTAYSSLLLPNNIVWAEAFNESSAAAINQGDTYSRSYAIWKENPPPTSMCQPTWPNGNCPYTNYSGWFVDYLDQNGAHRCFTHADCGVEPQNNFFPGMRRTEYAASSIALDIAQNVTDCTGVGTSTGVLQTDKTLTTQTVPTYGCEADGLRYRWVASNVTDPKNGVTYTVLFKTIIWEDWFATYVKYDRLLQKVVFTGTRDQMAIPAQLPTASFKASAAQVLPAGTDLALVDLGTASNPRVVYVEGDAVVNSAKIGYGVLIVNGALAAKADFTFNGTVIVQQGVSVTSGTFVVNGGFIVRTLAQISGQFNLYGGGAIQSPAAGPMAIDKQAWFERY